VEKKFKKLLKNVKNVTWIKKTLKHLLYLWAWMRRAQYHNKSCIIRYHAAACACRHVVTSFDSPYQFYYRPAD